ncbi:MULTISPECIES: hypothetical protein [Bacillus cereus group]|nr:hypothetical protein [Bacillus cereus]MBJ8009306.1 hypothetical protein [Bacillus cereus]MDM5460142.1 hypothetical protein [Bacillus cereus]
MKVMCIKNSGDTFSEGLLKQGYNRDGSGAKFTSLFKSSFVTVRLFGN